jgi:hypothetical protein
LSRSDACGFVQIGAMGASLDRGDLGGYFDGAELFDIPSTDPGPPIYYEAILGLVDVQLPLFPDPTGVCVSTIGGVHQYGGISVGFGMHAVAAIIDMADPIAIARIPGACGSPSMGDSGGG